jgi:hypothetical protein
MRYLVVSLALLVGGCALAAMTGRVRGDDHRVDVQATSALDALPLAASHCARFKRSAQYDRKASEDQYRYRCV